MKHPYMNPISMAFPNMQLARAYFLNQRYTRMFPLSEGFEKGTIFPDLYKPYHTKKR